MVKRIFRYLLRHIVLFLVNNVLEGTNPRFFEFKRNLLNRVGHKLGEGTKVVGPIICTGSLISGKNNWIGTNFCIRGNGTVILGDNCDIGPDVTFITGSHEIGSVIRRAGLGLNYNIKIGNGNWIGCRSSFVNNIEIGNSNVVAACSCVCKSFADNTLMGGVPAKVIKQLDV